MLSLTWTGHSGKSGAVLSTGLEGALSPLLSEGLLAHRAFDHADHGHDNTAADAAASNLCQD